MIKCKDLRLLDYYTHTPTAAAQMLPLYTSTNTQQEGKIHLVLYYMSHPVISGDDDISVLEKENRKATHDECSPPLNDR